MSLLRHRPASPLPLPSPFSYLPRGKEECGIAWRRGGGCTVVGRVGCCNETISLLHFTTICFSFSLFRPSVRPSAKCRHRSLHRRRSHPSPVRPTDRPPPVCNLSCFSPPPPDAPVPSFHSIQPFPGIASLSLPLSLISDQVGTERQTERVRCGGIMYCLNVACD